ncbi:YncE family protein [Clostridium paraputrificum]|uniref:YncE family protein n=1 Tax=Clostridium paraputrificum TaxID=29363 RepID=UPI003D348B7D
MKSIIVCNTAGDTISKVSLDDYSVKHLPLDLGEKPVGPHGIYFYKGNIITTNNYSNSISVVSLSNYKETKNLYVGAHPNDIKIYDDKGYIACGESNSLLIMDMINEKIIFEISLEEFPHSVAIDEKAKRVYVSNMEGHSVSIVDSISNKVIEKIKAPEYPTKILLSKDNKMLYICESYLGYEVEGYINVISTENYKTISRIKVGLTPVDMWEEEGRLYITNFTEGSISIVDIKSMKELKRIFLGGMPRGVVKYKDTIFIGDYLSGKIKGLNLKEQKIKTIAVGKEPNAMIIIEDYH